MVELRSGQTDGGAAAVDVAGVSIDLASVGMAQKVVLVEGGRFPVVFTAGWFALAISSLM
jgi:hypothetical protein